MKKKAVLKKKKTVRKAPKPEPVEETTMVLGEADEGDEESDEDESDGDEDESEESAVGSEEQAEDIEEGVFGVEDTKAVEAAPEVDVTQRGKSKITTTGSMFGIVGKDRRQAQAANALALDADQPVRITMLEDTPSNIRIGRYHIPALLRLETDSDLRKGTVLTVPGVVAEVLIERNRAALV